MTPAYWFEHREAGGFPVRRAAVGACDLSVLDVDVDHEPARNFGQLIAAWGVRSKDII